MRRRLLPFLTACALLLGGCWNRIEVTEQTFVLAAAVDKEEDGYMLTAQLVRPQDGAGAGASGSQLDAWALQARGSSLAEAARRLNIRTHRRLHWSHTRVIILGSDLAHEGIGPALEVLGRSTPIRPTVWLAVAEGQASEILLARPEIGTLPALGFLGYQGYAQQAHSMIPAMRLHEVERFLGTEGIEPALPLVRRAAAVEGAEKQELELAGAAIFKGNRMVGTLSEKEARGLLWVLGEVRRSMLTVPCPEGPESDAFSADLRRARSKVESAPDRAKIQITLDADLIAYGCEAPLSDRQSLRRLEAATAHLVQAEIGQTITVVRASRTDLLGIGRVLFRRSPALWRQAQDEWPERLAELPIQVDVEARIRRFGLTKHRPAER